MRRKKKSTKKQVEQRDKKYFETTSDTPKNVARALFGLKSTQQKKHATKT